MFTLYHVKYALWGKQVPHDDGEDIYHEIDTDCNGTISKAEFAAWWFDVDDSDLPDFSAEPKQKIHKLTKLELKENKEREWIDSMRMCGLTSNLPHEHEHERDGLVHHTV